MRYTDFNVVPCHIIESLPRSVLTPKPHLEYEHLKRKQFPQQVPDSSSTYLHLINQVLSHSWRSNLDISDVVAKLDDAKVPTHLRDKQISLIRSHLELLLPKLS